MFPLWASLVGLVTAARVGDGWGTNIHFTSETTPGEVAMLSKAYKVARMDLHWGVVEKVCGTYDFEPYDTLLAAMIANGTTCVLVHSQLATLLAPWSPAGSLVALPSVQRPRRPSVSTSLPTTTQPKLLC
jgi:hypothetical protein